MKLTKTSTALIIAGSIGVAALTAPLFADGGKNCDKRHHGKGHYSMMGGHGHMGKNPEKMIEKMSRKLDLTEEQRDQALAKLDEFKPQMSQAHQALRDGMKRIHEIDADADNFPSNLDALADEQGKLVADMIKLRTTMHVEFEQLLNEEQKAELKEMREKRAKRHGGDKDHG